MADKYLLESSPASIDVPVVNVSAADEGATTTHVLTVAAPGIAAGNRAFVAGIVAGGRTLTGVTDSVGGNTWNVDETLANSTNHGGGGASSKLTNALTAGATVTLTFSGTGVFYGALLDLGDGLGDTQPDISVSQAFTVAQTGVDSSTGATSDTADELQIGIAMHAGASTLTPETLSPVWTHLVSGSPTTFTRTIRIYYRIVSSTEAQRFAGTLSASQINTGFFITYRGAAGGPSTDGYALEAGNPATVVQIASGLDETVGPSTVSATFRDAGGNAVAPTNGNTLVAFVWERIDGGDTFSLDNGTWTQQREEFSGSGTNWPQRVYTQSDISNLSATTTLTVGTPSNARGIVVVELEGDVSFDTTTGASNTATTSGSHTPAAGTVIGLLSGTFNRSDSPFTTLLEPAGSMTELTEVKRYAVNYQRVTSSSGSYTVGSTGANANSSYIGISIKKDADRTGVLILEGTAGAIIRTLADTLSLADSVSRTVSLARTLSDSLTASDAVTRAGGFVRTAADSITLGDSVVRVLSLIRSPSDTLTLGDSVTRTVTNLRTASDSLTLGNAVTRAGGFVRTAADTLSFADSVAGIKIIARTAADTLNLADAVTRSGGFIRAASDTLGLSDAVARSGGFLRTASDSLTLSSVVDAVKSGAVVRTLSDTLNLSDSVSRTVTNLRTASDSLTLASVVAAVKVVPRTLSDSLTLGNTVSRVVSLSRTASDSLGLSSTVTRAGSFIRSAADSLSFTDSVVRLVSGAVLGAVGRLPAGIVRNIFSPSGWVRGDRPGGTARNAAPGGDITNPKPGGDAED